MFKIVTRFNSKLDSIKELNEVSGVERYDTVVAAKEALRNILNNINNKSNTVNVMMSRDYLSFISLSTVRTSFGDAYQVVEYSIEQVL